MAQTTNTFDNRASPATPLYSFPDIAKAAAVCLATVYNWHHAGWLESSVIGKCRRVTPEQWARFQARAARGEFSNSDKAAAA